MFPLSSTPIVVTVILMIAASLVTAAYLVVSRKRSIPRLDIELEELPEIANALPLLAGLTGSSVHNGNAVVIYQNGDLLEALMEAIREAEHTIHLETYIWASGKLEEKFVNLLCMKAEQGLSVRVLVDALGAWRASASQIKKLRASGVKWARYHPIKWYSLRRFNNRTHRKLLIVDGNTAFIFGHGIEDVWCGQAQDKDHWRDTGIRLRGSLVCTLQAIFAQDWIEADPRLPVEEGCFVDSIEQAGSIQGHVVVSSARGGHSPVALLYMLAIACARREIIIQNPYFAPNRAVCQLLRRVASRGVAVHLMVPGKHNDSRFLRRASQHLYGSLLRAGVKLYEFDPTLLHQKIVIVDTVWSHIGSTNFDSRSLALNAEIGVGLLDQGVAGDLRRAYEDDLLRSRELTLQGWESRPWYQRLLDWTAYHLHGQV